MDVKEEEEIYDVERGGEGWRRCGEEEKGA